MHPVTRATLAATPAAPGPIGGYIDHRHAPINRAHAAIVLGMLGCPTVDQCAAQDPSEWQRLAVAEQARRAALSR